MDNFRRPKRPQSGAIDGVFSSGEKQPSANRRDKSEQSEARAEIGNFRQPDGFNATERPGIARNNNEVNSSAMASNSAGGGVVLNRPWTEGGDYRRPKSKKPKSLKKRLKAITLKRVIIGILLILLALGIYMGLKAYFNARNVLQGGGHSAAWCEDVDPSLFEREGDGRINIMMLGKDDAADLTDSIIIASIECRPEHQEVAMLHIPRDLWVTAPSGGSMKINAVYPTERQRFLAQQANPDDASKAALKSLEQTLEDVLGIPLHYYVTVDFEAFEKAIDTVGGIEVHAEEALYDHTVAWKNNGNPQLAKEGLNQFDGHQALLYARSRMTSPRGDFDRGLRQQKIIIGLQQKVLSVGTFGNPARISQLMDDFSGNIQTNFSVDEVRRLYELAGKVNTEEIKSYGLAEDEDEPLVTTGMIDGQSAVMPVAGIADYSEIHHFVRNTLRDSYLKKEDANIIVLNGANLPNLATNKREELESFGYRVTSTADAPGGVYNNTVLVDLRNGQNRYTQHYLERRLNTTATKNLPDGIEPGMADFVIIVGQNET